MQCRRLWIVNVHDLKPAAYDLNFSDMAWDINSVSPLPSYSIRKIGIAVNSVQKREKSYCRPCWNFYRLCGIRKPEFMGWNQVELDKKKYIKGLSPIKNTDFSLTEFSGELDRYLESYESIKRILSEVEPIIPQERKDASLHKLNILYSVQQL